MFSDRFEGSAKHGSARERLAFEGELARANTIKDAWAFIWDDALRYNVAYALQGVHFDILLVNHYNVYWAPEALKFKQALVAVASVVEAVLQYMIQMVEDDPRVQEVLGSKWNWLDFNAVPLPGIEVPEGQRAVTGLQQEVQNVLDRNTKMRMLIRCARKAGILDEPLAKELDELRDIRNRIHLKTLTAPEYRDYTPEMANDALDVLERFRVVALTWTVGKRAEDMTFDLNTRAQRWRPPTTTSRSN
jgi:hypothetical protein